MIFRYDIDSVSHCNCSEYKEYERSALAQDRPILPRSTIDAISSMTTKPAILSIVNPCNPTGDFLSLEKLKEWILNNSQRGTFVLVDESMLPWIGPDFQQYSAVQFQHEFVSTHGVFIFVIHSWTKIWSCPGLRLGSIICPTEDLLLEFKRKQVPWSVNGPALAFLNTVVCDKIYMQQTWDITSKWRAEIYRALKEISNGAWDLSGETWLSWIWVNVKDEMTAEKLVNVARQDGVPIRWGKHGYGRPEHIRIAVRHPDKVNILIQAFRKALAT